MARPKLNEITAKIIRAESLRLGKLERDSRFERDLLRLNRLAKQLPGVPLIPVSQLNEKNWRLSDHDERNLSRWNRAAMLFLERWNFRPYLDNDNTVRLFIRSPVSLKIRRDRTIKIEMDLRDHPHGDVNALLSHYKSVRDEVQKRRGNRLKTPRRHLDSMAQKIRATELGAIKRTPKEIAADLFPAEYEKTLPWEAATEEKFRCLAAGYLDPPFNLQWPEAAQRAGKELGLDLRSESAKSNVLMQRVRDLLRNRSKK